MDSINEQNPPRVSDFFTMLGPGDAEYRAALFSGRVSPQQREPDTRTAPGDIYIQNQMESARVTSSKCAICGAVATGRFCPECGYPFDAAGMK